MIIHGLERATAINRARLIESFRSIDPPIDAAMVTAGTALIVVDLAPGIGAVTGLFSGNRRSGKRSERLLKLIVEVPLLVRSIRRLTGRQGTP